MREVNVGDVVDVVTESNVPVKALVVCVHSQWCINTVFASPDPSKQDVYGRQLERLDSLQRKDEHTANGRYFEAE